ncbi:MAG: pyridoxamine 5'-phosphate oxidase family protein [Deltaproteobacteria bacterium]|nr:pyridoxamine 5'-phosphate oxidase family protein [Deltaproteobacteria bacterium]
MRRKDKKITDTEVIDNIINRSTVCRLALSETNLPYIVPVCFGYRSRTLYVHSAQEGKKIDILRKNNNVCVEFDVDHELVKADGACTWGMKYRSVICYGTASFVDGDREKREALDVIMAHYSTGSFEYIDKKLADTIIIKIEIESITGKQSGY